MKFERFQIHNAADEDLGFLFHTQDDAVTQAQQLDGPVCVVALTFEYTDTELVWTSDGSDVWPPPGESAHRAVEDLIVEPLITVPELAESWRCSRATIYNMLRRGMPSLMIGSARRFRRSECEGWLAEQTSPPFDGKAQR